MKKNLFIMALCAMSALVACNKELPGDDAQTTGDVVTYTATVDGADTKTILDGKLSKWESGDKITLHNGTTGFEFSTTDAGATATFSYTGNDYSAPNGVMAVYPAGEYTADLAAKTVSAHISTWQGARDNSYNHDAAVAVAYSEDNTLAFKNATALLKFTVKNENVTHFNFYGKNSEPLSGDVLITLNEDNTIKSVEPQETLTEGSSLYRTNVEVYAWQSDEVLYFKSGTTYYAAVAPQTLSGFGIKLRVNGTDQEVKSYDNEITLEPNTIYDLGELEYIVPETVAKLYVEDHTGWDALYVYTHGEVNDAFGGWPGAELKETVVKGEVTYKVYDVPNTVVGKSQNLIFNNNAGTQLTDLPITFQENDEIYVYVNPYGAVVYNYGETPTPPAAPVVPTAPTPEENKLYLNANEVWNTDGAWFSVWFYGSSTSGDTMVAMDDLGGGYYACSIPDGGYTTVIFCRRDPATPSIPTDNAWTGVWNQSNDLAYAYELGKLYTITGWNEGKGVGEWSMLK